MKKPWPTARLGEVLKEERHRVGTSGANGLPLLGVSNKRGLQRAGVEPIADLSRYVIVERDWFAYNPMRVNVGSLGWAATEEDAGVISPDYVVFSCGERILPRYVFEILRHRRGLQAINAETAGSVRERLYFSSLARIEIPLPPLAEQQRIVARIEALAAKVGEAHGLRKDAVEAAESLLQARLREVFGAAGERYGERSFEEFSPHVTSGPRNWGVHYHEQGEYRFYRAQDIGADCTVTTASRILITPPAGEQGRSAMPVPGDLMIVITGATVGRVALIVEGLEPGFVSQHVGLCRLPRHHVEPAYAWWGLRAPAGQEQLLGQRYGQGKPGLNLLNIRNLRLPFPPVAEQRRIVAYLASLQAKADALQRLQAETAAELDALMPAVLDRAFRGEL